MSQKIHGVKVLLITKRRREDRIFLNIKVKNSSQILASVNLYPVLHLIFGYGNDAKSHHSVTGKNVFLKDSLNSFI